MKHRYHALLETWGKFGSCAAILLLLLVFATQASADYWVTYSGTGATGPVRLGQDVEWSSGDTKIVSEEVIGWYNENSSVFTVTEVTATGAEVNAAIDGGWASISTTAVDGTDGTATVQMIFKDAAGTTMAAVSAGTFYLSEVATCATVDAADTSIAVLTNGAVTLVDTGVPKYYNYITSAAGLLGVTVTAAADSYWLCFQKGNGLLATAALSITGP